MFNDFDETMKKYGGNSDWLVPKVGDNKVRLVTNFIDYGNHYIEEEKKSYICIGKEEGCAYCHEGLTPSPQFLGWVIDRTDNKLKLFRIGYQIASQIAAFKKSEEYSFDELPPYDMIVHRDGEGKGTKYTVIAARENSELTKEEKFDIEQNAKDPEEIIKSMKDKINPLKGLEPKEKSSLPKLKDEDKVKGEEEGDLSFLEPDKEEE